MPSIDPLPSLAEIPDESKNPLIYEIKLDDGQQTKFTILPGGRSEIIFAGMTYQPQGIIPFGTMYYLINNEPLLTEITPELQKCIYAIQALHSKSEFWGKDNIDHIFSFYNAVKHQSDRLISHFSEKYPELEKKYLIPELPQEQISRCLDELRKLKHDALLNALNTPSEPASTPRP